MRKKRQKGFSLMEVMVVIGIIGILALIAIPSFRVFLPNLHLAGAARDLASDLRYAEQLSVTEQIDHGIRFFLDTDEYRLIKYDTTEVELQARDLPDTVSFQSVSGFTNNEAKFNPYGAAREAGVIILENTNNGTTSIDVRPSGFIKISK